MIPAASPFPAEPALDQPRSAATSSRVRSPWGRRLRRAALAFGLFLLIGNGIIIGTHLVLGQVDPPAETPVEIAGVDNLTVVDSRVWRSGAPAEGSYDDLAGAGVSTIVDLRAEDDAYEHDRLIRAAGMDVVHVPIRDGQTPSADDVRAVLDAVDRAPGTVLLHCGAGVGRTGAVAAAYLVLTGQADAGDAVTQNLAVGPPSLEQIVYASRLEADGVPVMPITVKVVSRVLDGPRRLWHVLT